jgi:N-methylhydantoinase A
MPGPVCYNRGGTQPTCTDANVVLGYLNPNFFAGGKIPLEVEKTRAMIRENLGSKLGLSELETAVGMYRIINTNMAQGVRQVSVERGYDPRESLLIVAGGAGPIHSGEICKELGIPMFVVPSVSSIFCAAGMLLGDLKHDYVRSFITNFSSLEKRAFLERFNQMREIGVATVLNEGVTEEQIELNPTIDLRYAGQYHEVPLTVPWEAVTAFDIESIKKKFHAEHNRQFGYSLDDDQTEIELINIRLRVLGKTVKPDLFAKSETPVELARAVKARRSVYIPETNDMREVNVYDGDMPLYGHTIHGPAIIERITTSIVVSDMYDCLIDRFGSFIVYNNTVFPNGAGVERK